MSSMKCLVWLMALVAMVMAPSRGQAQTPNPLFSELETTIATKEFGGSNLTLKDFLGKLYEITKQKGKALPMLIDVEAFREAYPELDEGVLYDTPVKFPPVPPEMTIDTALRLALSKVPTKNATYVVLPDRILITTFERTTAEAKLHEKVRGAFEKRPLNLVLNELSHKLGTTIVIDNRCGDKAESKITATFINDIPLAGALRILTEMADLKVVVLDGAILVTTPAHAETLRKEHQKKITDNQQKITLLGGFGNPGSNPIPGTIGFPVPDSRFLDPLWPYDPDRPSGYSRREPAK